MNLNEFKDRIEILSSEERRKVRISYQTSFLSVDSKSFKENIEVMHKYVDGYCYNGYLWDYLRDPVQIDELHAKQTLKGLNRIYVLWDINSCEKILIEDYWKFDKYDVLLLDSETLIDGMHLLPEDIYIFDTSYKWTIIFTHEYIENNRYCITQRDDSTASTAIPRLNIWY